MMRAVLFQSLAFVCIAIIMFSFPQLTSAADTADVPVSEETQACIECHASYTPGIVMDWQTSRHARTTPESAQSKNHLEKRISSTSIPGALEKVVVGCYECHGLNKENHKDNFEHFDYNINVVVSPEDCKTCHETEVIQYQLGKKAHALFNLRDNPVYHRLVETITSVKTFKDGAVITGEASESTKHETCYACHGTEVKVSGTKTLKTDLGNIEVPVLTHWPNQGVGRINPDGSRGACTACHPRHSFSIEIARKPETCGQCHLEPDLPAYNVYKESKHGNIYDAKKHEWVWDTVPWKVGTDFKAPTCATCHNSLLVNTDNELIVARSHDFSARLWVRIFGLIYSHPQPKSGETYLIKNADGLPLPTTFSGKLASEYLLDPDQQTERKSEMVKVCKSCHGPSWVAGHFEKFDNTLRETDQMTLTATLLLLNAWDKKLADNTNPFDEAIEQLWIKQWLFYANSIRYASAMAGPDYAAFKNGWWQLTNNLQVMKKIVGLK